MGFVDLTYKLQKQGGQKENAKRSVAGMFSNDTKAEDFIHACSVILATHLVQHEVGVLAGAALHAEQSADVLREAEDGLLVLDLVPVLQLQRADILVHPVVLRHLQFVRLWERVKDDEQK